ncbi:MAG: TonB-dependent receptor [Chitinophagaceae bacterium]
MRLRLHPLFCTLALTGISSLTALAQEPDSEKITPKIPHQLQEVEVKNIRVSAISPFSKTDISREDLEKQNLGQDLPVMLQMTQSAVSSSDAGAGVGYTGLRVRGTDGTRINVTLNGVPVNDAESQGTFFVNLPDLASTTSSIQLQRGVGSSTNGGAAFGATMSISNMAQSDTAYASLNASAGSFNTQKYTLKAGTGLLSSGWQFDVRLSKLSSDGYVQRSASDLKSGQFIAGWQISPETKFRFQVLSGKEKTGQAWNGVSQDSLSVNRRYNELGMKSDGSFYNNQTDNYMQTYYQAFLDHNFGKSWSGTVGLFLTRGKGYYEEYKLGQSYSDYGLPNFTTPAGDTITSTDLIRQLWLDNYFYGGLYGLQYAKGRWKVNLGGAVSQYTGLHYGYVKWAQAGVPSDYQWYRNDAMKNDYNQYLKAEFTPAKGLTLYGDMQVRGVTYFMNGFRKNDALHPSVNYLFFNPKFGASYLLENKNRKLQRLYASVASASKEPNRDDFEASPAQLPKPERLLNVEAGYEIKRSKWSFLANYYLMSYKNQLVLNGQINDVGAYTRVNVGKSYRTGIELSGAVRPAKWIQIDANATLASNKIRAFDEYVDNYDNGNQDVIHHTQTDIAFSPSFISAAGITVIPFLHFRYASLRNLDLGLWNKTVSRQYLDNTSDKSRSIDGYSLLDLRINYHVDLGHTKLHIRAGIYNLLNRKYQNNGYTYAYISGGSTYTSNYYFPQAGTNFLAGLGLDF